MTPDQYRAILEKLGLTQLGAARLLDVNERTSRRWAEHGVTGMGAILLRLLVRGRITPDDIEQAKG